jgi:hypothetical protein
MSKSLSKSSIVWMTFVRQSYAESAREHLMCQGFGCLPIEEAGTDYILGFIMNAPALTTVQQHVLEDFYATEIEVYPLNARLDYQNYSHSLYYNDYEQLDTDLGYLIEEHVDKRVMAFDEHEIGAYEWKIVFCTREEMAQEQKDLFMAAIQPVAWLWNEPVRGDVSPTSIFK